MRSTSQTFISAKADLAGYLDRWVPNPEAKVEVAKLIARFTAAAVKDDRVRRSSESGMPKLFDVLRRQA